MDLSAFDGRLVRLIDGTGDVFDGECEYLSQEAGEVMYGFDSEGLMIDEYFFSADDIQSVAAHPGGGLFWQSRPEHFMRLAPKPFDLIDGGKKTVEMRLYDEKRRKLSVGDVIRFERTDDETEIIHVRVTEIKVFPSFAGLYAAYTPAELGYSDKETASPDDMNAFYTKEDQDRFGVVGIRIEAI